MLPRRGQVTAGDVAAEPKVSEGTARRDLGVAGLPILRGAEVAADWYARPGRAV